MFLHTLEGFVGTSFAPAPSVQLAMYLYVRGRVLFGSNGDIMSRVGDANQKRQYFCKRMLGWMQRGRVSCTHRSLPSVVLNKNIRLSILAD